MSNRTRNPLPTIHTEGGLLPSDLLQRILNRDKSLAGLDPESYHLAQNEKLNEAISRSWNRLQGDWAVFCEQREKLGGDDTGTTVTRERWLLPLFQELNYGRLTGAKSVDIQGKSFAISHRWDMVPLHLVGCNLSLNVKSSGVAGASRVSPHSLVQEYLNLSDDAQWGIVTNGLKLRVLRDYASLTRQAYLEFDLEAMFTGEAYSDFVLLWMVCHQSRFETRKEQDGKCLLEVWSQTAREQGTRALDTLRGGVEEAIRVLGSGFLQHPSNTVLNEKLRAGTLQKQDYFWQVLRLVYRMIFLFVAEDRDVLLLPDAPVEAKERYLKYYSTARLREIVEHNRGSRHSDRYELLTLVMDKLGKAEGSPNLALPALGGWLFSDDAMPDLAGCRLENRALFAAVYSLAYLKDDGLLRAVDYRNLGPEELGSVYESLLELHPDIDPNTREFSLYSAAGNERKTTGSYYTPTSLINELLNSALDPVIEQALKDKPDFTAREAALLELTVCDPACGSGHFLVNAAHRLARRLAEIRSGGDEPSPEVVRAALRDVTRKCIYGVDINPMAVELCKVNLWLESIEPGKPLTFLDAHIKCGNSLVGVGPKMDINKLVVPSEAFNPVTGDDKATAALLKKRNKEELIGAESLFVTVMKTQEDLQNWLAGRARALYQMAEESMADVQAKADAYHAYTGSDQYRKQKQVADLWTAAFFWKIEKPHTGSMTVTAPTHGQLRRLLAGQMTQSGLLDAVAEIAATQGFFHYPVEYPEVMERGGFDCVLGNPPWERIKLQEEEFFASKDPDIARAINKAARQKLINNLNETNPLLLTDFNNAKHNAECTSKFVRESERFKLSAVGDVNTYALFSEHDRDLMNRSGYSGFIVPTGIATDDTTKDFFGDLVEKREIASIFDFENKEAIFPGVHRSYKFSLLTLSGSPVKAARFGFFAIRVEHLRDNQRQFTLDPGEIALFNPNTRTMPVFRTRADAELTREIYKRVPVLINERTSENPWGVSFLRMFDMSNDSGLFISEPREEDVRLYEAKMIHQYDHRWASYENSDFAHVQNPRKYYPSYLSKGRYFVPYSECLSKIEKKWNHRWVICYRRIARSTDERTLISCIGPVAGYGDILPLVFSNFGVHQLTQLVGDFNSIICDYVVRQKIGGIHIDFLQLRQIPILSPGSYSENDRVYIENRIIELVYTAQDIIGFAEELGYQKEPFHWDEDRRAILRAELDAYYARLYSLNHKQLRYILDPADLTRRELEDILDPWEEVSDALDPEGYEKRVEESDFPGETFRVLKDKEIRQYGEYRTRRLVLEAWERIKDLEIGNPEGYTSSAAPVREVREAAQEYAAPRRDVMTENAAQPTLTDFGLYKCLQCGRMIVGYDRENHVNEQHGGGHVEWKKMG